MNEDGKKKKKENKHRSKITKSLNYLQQLAGVPAPISPLPPGQFFLGSRSYLKSLITITEWQT